MKNNKFKFISSNENIRFVYFELSPIISIDNDDDIFSIEQPTVHQSNKQKFYFKNHDNSTKKNSSKIETNTPSTEIPINNSQFSLTKIDSIPSSTYARTNSLDWNFISSNNNNPITIDPSSEQSTSLSNHQSNENIPNYTLQLSLISSGDDGIIVPMEHDTPSTNRNVYLIRAYPTALDIPTQSPLPTKSNTSTKPKYEKELSAEERKKLHNRTCTLKQRTRYFHHKITKKNIDKRFTIKQIKKILKQHDIPVTAVNFLRSPNTNEKTLAIGLKDITKLSTYEDIVVDLFTKQHYEQIRHNKSKSRSSTRRHLNHHHF
ncbi:unnamed protein product [Rotaria sordida]|uniref:Uncharacterized protein n=1 Tax=Rotaria sordida TaxID=392033 RepID=A0A815XRT5_9BILA|nr:unnamed protein product [Rotaria sordida]CAF1560978.1 unnamed protein product [Rotaria sordida]